MTLFSIQALSLELAGVATLAALAVMPPFTDWNTACTALNTNQSIIFSFQFNPHLSFFFLTFVTLNAALCVKHIFPSHQDKDIPFNRGFLFNVGFMEALKDNNYGCFVFHDVDLLPLNDFNLYQCPDQPKHLSVAIDKYKFKYV